MPDAYDREPFRLAAPARVRRAMRRNAWLLSVLFFVVTPGAYLATAELEVVYRAEGALWIETMPTTDAVPSTVSGSSGAWVDLLRSYQVLESAVTSRDATLDLAERLSASMDRGGNFLLVSLEGSDPQEVTDDLNAVMGRFVEVAWTLERTKLEETLGALEKQLGDVEVRLLEAERDLEAFLARTEGASTDRPAYGDEQSGEERRLMRRVRSIASLHDEVRTRVETSRLAVAVATPDVRILDEATVPRRPSEDPRLPLAAALLLGCFAAGLGGALMRDRTGREDAIR